MKKQARIIFLILVTGALLSKAQDASYRFINFNYKDGLQDKFFYDALNDKTGMMWIASGSGLYSYDGNRFVLYRSKHRQTGLELSNLIRSIYLDNDGIIWTAGLNSLQWFNPVTKTFYYHSNRSLKQLENAVVNFFYRDSEGNMWMSTEKNGVALFNKKDSSVVFFKPSDEAGASANFITKIIETPGHLLWALSVDGIHLFTKEKGIIKTFRDTRAGPNPADENYFIDGFYDHQMNCLWIGTYGGSIVKFDLATKKMQHFDISILFASQKITKNAITAVVPKSETELWFYNGGLAVFNKYAGKVTRQVTPDVGNEFGFKTTVVARIFNDKEGNLWLCSFNGLSMLPWQNNQWQTINLIDTLAGNQILEPTNVCQIPGSPNFFIATSGAKGLGYFNTETNRFSVINIKNKATATSVHVFNNKLYAACANDVYVFNSTSFSFAPLNITYNGSAVNGPVWRMFNDGKESLLLASPQNGFYKYNLISGKTEHYNIWDVDTGINRSETENTIWPSYADSRGNIWFTRSQYLYYADSNFRFHKVAYNDSENQPGINQPFEIAEDINKHYWVTTKINGIYEFYINEKGKEIICNYNTSNTPSLPSDYFIRIVKDEQGMLWLGSLSGLVKFDPVQKKVVAVYRKKHGLVNDNIDVPLSMLPGNKLIISNYGALNLININSYKLNKTVPVPVISTFKVMDKLIQLPATDTVISLSYNQNFLQLELACLSYNNSDENKFAYKLEGVDKDWVYTSRNYVTYSGLSNGSYIFKLKVANNDNLWSQKELHIKIIIQPPFWKTWWFVSLVLAVAVYVIYWFNRNRVLQIRKQEKLKAAFNQQIAETEMKALRAQMNPHFIFNSLNSIQKYILKNEHWEATLYLTKFSRLIRLILDHSNQNNILLSSELDLLRLYIEMESLRFDNKFDYEIKIDKNVNTEIVQVPSMLIQPYVENAIWHGLLHKTNKGKLTIELFISSNSNLTVIIDDNGIGREKAAELKSKQVLKKKSYGMQITENRIKIINRMYQINATCEVSDKKDSRGHSAGTTIKLTIPFQSLTN